MSRTRFVHAICNNTASWPAGWQASNEEWSALQCSLTTQKELTFTLRRDATTRGAIFLYVYYNRAAALGSYAAPQHAVHPAIYLSVWMVVVVVVHYHDVWWMANLKWRQVCVFLLPVGRWRCTILTREISWIFIRVSNLWQTTTKSNEEVVDAGILGKSSVAGRWEYQSLIWSPLI